MCNRLLFRIYLVIYIFLSNVMFVISNHILAIPWALYERISDFKDKKNTVEESSAGDNYLSL